MFMLYVETKLERKVGDVTVAAEGSDVNQNL